MAYIVAHLIHILEQFQDHLNLVILDKEDHLDPNINEPYHQPSVRLVKSQLDHLLDQTRSFVDFLVNTPPLRYTGFEREIADIAHKAEDIVEDCIRNRILAVDSDYGTCHYYFACVVEKFDNIRKRIDSRFDDQYPRLLPVDSSPPRFPLRTSHDPSRNSGAVFFEDEFQTLKARLIQGPSKLQTIPIYGMPGMGKRTLARRLYDDSSIASHFKTFVWVNAGVNLDTKFLLLNLLDGLGIITDDMYKKNVNQLGALVYKTLRKTKFLIVLHDLCKEDVWVRLKRFFPDDNVGGRLLITAWRWDEEKLSTHGELHHKRFLTDSESRMFLCRNVFKQEHCPNEFESTGKIILELCKGVPQAIVCISGLLATSEKTPTYWELVETVLTSQLEGLDLDDLSQCVSEFTYIHLPYYLKPCFLYIAFNACCDIQASKIIKLWIAEGFVKQIADKTLEDIAHEYLEILIDKNLLYLTREEPNGRVKTFQSQLLLNRVCLSFASKDNFLMFHNSYADNVPEESSHVRRVSIHPLSQPNIDTPLLARSFLVSAGRASLRLASLFLELRRLKVLDVFQIELYQLPLEILEMVLLTFLAFSCHSNLPSSISKLQNLQTLIIRRLPSFRSFSLPSELWEMAQLRHVKCKETFLCYYSEDQKKVLHGKLQTLSSLQLFGVTDDFLGKIPNVRKLGIFCNIEMQATLDLSCLDKLERLKCISDWSLASRNFLSHLSLTPSLKKLTLSLCKIPCRFMIFVGSLRSLEQLKLQKSDFLDINSGPTESEWEPTEGEFSQLLSLVMVDLNLVHWRARAAHFPMLQRLIIQTCYAMEEIPLDMGNIKTLELIQVDETSPLALASVMQLKKEQQGLGNKVLQVHTHKIR